MLLNTDDLYLQVVIFRAPYRRGRIFGGEKIFWARVYWGIKYFEKITRYLMGCQRFRT